MKLQICLHCCQIILLFLLLNRVALSQTICSNISTSNERTDLERFSQNLVDENLITMKMTTDMSFLDTDWLNENFYNASYIEEPPSKKRLKRSVSKSANERPQIYLLALEEVKKPGSKEKREISKKVIPLCLYALGKTLRKRSLVNDSIIDKVIEKYFPKIKEKSPPVIKYKVKNRREVQAPKLTRNIEFFKDNDYLLYSEPMNIDKLNVITEANRTLDHISKLTECDSVEMPDAMKKPLIAVLFKRISNIYADKNKIKQQ